jgi:hypothetical protein
MAVLAKNRIRVDGNEGSNYFIHALQYGKDLAANKVFKGIGSLVLSSQ